MATLQRFAGPDEIRTITEKCDECRNHFDLNSGDDYVCCAVCERTKCATCVSEIEVALGHCTTHLVEGLERRKEAAAAETVRRTAAMADTIRFQAAQIEALKSLLEVTQMNLALADRQLEMTRVGLALGATLTPEVAA